VVHWAILDKKPLPSIRKKFVKGATFKKLILEPWAAHPEAETEGRGEPEDPELLALPTFMCVGD
jgi:hypothetical protein